MRDLRNRSVLVTGAASGIGRATSIALAREGADPLILNDINAEGLSETVSHIESLGGRAMGLVADVRDFEAVKAMVDASINLFGEIDVLVNVAGIGTMCPFLRLDIEDWKEIIDVNLWGPINTVLSVFPHMAARRSGHIVNISSISGLWGDMLYVAPYITSKFGVVGLSQALLIEGSLYGIGVSCVCPGVVRTPIYGTGKMKGFKPEARELTRYLFRIGESPEDTARAIVSAIKKNRFIVVTTPLFRVDYILRRHFPRIYLHLDRLWPRLMDRLTARYRIRADGS
jgi:NAD(P)-dependent dehydrogenase (short-subunit alcohol dehydrogenase family)